MPGTAKVLEERLGRPGYHLGTVVTLFVALTLMLAPCALILIMVNQFTQGSVHLDTALNYLFPVVLFIVLLPLVFGGFRLVMLRACE